MKTVTRCRIAILLSLVLAVSVIPQNVFAASTTKTVSTQKGLDKALASESTKKIIIETDKNKTLTVDEAANPNVALVVDAAFATVNVNAKVKKLTVQRADGISVMGNIGTLKLEGEAGLIELDKDALIKKIRIDADDFKLSLKNSGSISHININAPGASASIIMQGDSELGKIYVNKKAELNLSGEASSKVGITVKPAAEGTRIVASDPINLNLYAGADLTLKGGAEYSKISLKNEGSTISLTNNTLGKITITDAEGSKTTVAKGESTEVITGLKEEDKEEDKKEDKSESEKEDIAKETEKKTIIPIEISPDPITPAEPQVTDEINTYGDNTYRVVTTFAQNNSSIKVNEKYYIPDTGDLAVMLEYDNSGTKVSHRYDYNYGPNAVVTREVYCDADGNFHYDIKSSNPTDHPHYAKYVYTDLYSGTISTCFNIADSLEGLEPTMMLSSMMDNCKSSEKLDNVNLKPDSDMGDVPSADSAIEFSKVEYSNGKKTQETYKYYANVTDFNNDDNVLRTVTKTYNGGTLTTTVTTATNNRLLVEKTETGNTKTIARYEDGKIRSKTIITYTDGGLVDTKEDLSYYPGGQKLNTSILYASQDGTLANMLEVKNEHFEYNDSGAMTKQETSEYNRNVVPNTINYTIIFYEAGSQAKKIVCEYQSDNTAWYLWTQKEYSNTTGTFSETAHYEHVNGDFEVLYLYPNYYGKAQTP